VCFVSRDNANATDLVWIHSNFTRFHRGQDLPGTNPGKQVQFHPINRKTHKRFQHQHVDEAGKAEKADIVKGLYPPLVTQVSS